MKDANGNYYCTICPKTLSFLQSMHESRGEVMPRHFANRKMIATRRGQPCGNSLYLKVMHGHITELKESYTAERLQNDRTHRRLAARIEMAEKNASGQPAASHEERLHRVQSMTWP